MTAVLIVPPPDGPPAEDSCVLFHVDDSDMVIHEEVRRDSRGDLVVEGWTVDKENIAEEESWRLRVAADQTEKLEATLRLALYRAGGAPRWPGGAVAALREIEAFHWRGGVPGAVRFRMWLDGTDIAYEWDLEAVKEKRNQSFRKAASPTTELPGRPGETAPRLRSCPAE